MRSMIEAFTHRSPHEAIARYAARFSSIHYFSILLCLLMLTSGCGESGKRPGAEHHRQEVTTPNVAPGTELKEADLEAVLRATEARYIVVSIFAPYCGPCLAEAVELAQRRPAWEHKGIALLGLGLCEDQSECRKFFDYTGGRADYPLYLAPWAQKTFSVETTPTILILGPRGESLFSVSGSEGESPHTAVDRKLKELLKL